MLQWSATMFLRTPIMEYQQVENPYPEPELHTIINDYLTWAKFDRRPKTWKRI